MNPGTKRYADSLKLPSAAQPPAGDGSHAEQLRPAATNAAPAVDRATVQTMIDESVKDALDKRATNETAYELRGLAPGTAAYARSLKLPA
jgi:hypothetical protein